MSTTLPELPRVTVATDYIHPTGALIAVTAQADLQPALDKAQPGDLIVLKSGVTFTGNFVLPAKQGAGWITVRSSADLGWANEGQRPAFLGAGNMAKIQTDNLQPAFATAHGAHHWRLMGLEIAIAPKSNGCYALVFLDTDSDATTMPHHCIVDRCYIHGNALGSARRAVQLGGSHMAVIDSHISGFRSIFGHGTESQCVTGYNGPGPYRVANNYLEASTENVFFGGGVGPSGRVIPSDIEIVGNHMTKPLAWRKGIMPPPIVQVTPGTGAPAFYQVVAGGSAGSDQGEIPIRSGFVELTAQAGETLTWPEVTYGDAEDTQKASSYAVFRTTDPPTVNQPRKFDMFHVSGLTWTDAGQPPDSTLADPNTQYPPFRSDGDIPLVKNLLELKTAQRVLIEGNVMENCWFSGQQGNAITLTPRTAAYMDWSQDYIDKYANPAAVVSDITIRKNLIRNCAIGLIWATFDDLYPGKDGAHSARVLLEENVMDLDGKEYGPFGHATGVRLFSPVDFTARRNTIVVSGEFSVARHLGGGVSTRESWTGNILTGDLDNDNPPMAGPGGLFQAPGVTGLEFAGNALIGRGQQYLKLDDWRKIPGVTVAELAAVLPGLAAGDYTAVGGCDWAALAPMVARVLGTAPAVPVPVAPVTPPTTAQASAGTGLTREQLAAVASALRAFTDALNAILAVKP